jgi:P pilus assembly chaperone PapD
MNTLFKPGLIISLILLLVSTSANASGGIALGATRVIYPAEAKQTSLAITNSNKQERYLINAWIENASGQKEKRSPLHRHCLLASRTAKTRCELFTPGLRCPRTANRCFT